MKTARSLRPDRRSICPGKTIAYRCSLLICWASLLAACGGGTIPVADYYGTTEPFASQAVYFVVTDRFVDGDPTNNFPEQGGTNRSFDLPLTAPDGTVANIGYLGGDLKGVLDNGAYIRDLGFTSVWITPIVDNPDESFTGGYSLGQGHAADKGKAAYHGYWGVNFYEVDEHLESEGLTFADFTQAMKQQHSLDIVLDIVCNHGSPAWSMPVDQPKYGELYDAQGSLVADHQNLHPEQLDKNNPLHKFFNTKPDLAELADLDDTNPAVLDYMVDAYLQWIDQGAAAFRIDTIRHMGHPYWKQFSDRIRERHPGFFMFGEHFDYDPAKLAQHQLPENGAISVLDFPGRQQMTTVFENADSDYSELLSYLHLDDGVYTNPYELMTFYDNHDVPRMNASKEGFIDANNWLFTSRGIPVLYYGSEVAHMAGKGEHEGNRNFYGQERVAQASEDPVYQSLRNIANVRQQSPALQRGLQVNLEFSGDKAAFYRVYQQNGVTQTALVLLNKGSDATEFAIDRWLSNGTWEDAMGDERFTVSAAKSVLTTRVDAHGVKVLLFDGAVNDVELQRQLDTAMRAP